MAPPYVTIPADDAEDAQDMQAALSTPERQDRSPPPRPERWMHVYTEDGELRDISSYAPIQVEVLYRAMNDVLKSARDTAPPHNYHLLCTLLSVEGQLAKFASPKTPVRARYVSAPYGMSRSEMDGARDCLTLSLEITDPEQLRFWERVEERVSRECSLAFKRNSRPVVGKVENGLRHRCGLEWWLRAQHW